MIFRKSKLLLTTIFFLSFFQSSYSNEIIIPKKKPAFKSQIVIPPLKPGTFNEKQSLKDDKDLPKEIFGILLPPKKPLIVKKQTLRTVKKTRYYSERDFEFAKQAIRFMEKSNWKDAKNTAKKARAQSIYDFIEWRHLLTSGNKATFSEYKRFIERVKDYPRFDRIKYLAEHKINLQNQSPTEIINWFQSNKPLSGYGKIMLGESLIKTGKSGDGIRLIKEGFINADLNTNNLKYIRKKFKKILDTSDYINRADYYAWEGKHWDLKRVIRYLPSEYQLLYTARQILISRGYGVDEAIKKVPKKFKNDAGLNYDRLKWRRKKGRVDSSLEILNKVKNTEEYLVRPDKWWKERSIIGRSLIYKKKYKTAYKIVSNHAMTEGADYAEAEWMSGWIALSFLKNAQQAENHFLNFYNNVSYPISLSRGAYWLGKTYEKIGDKENIIAFCDNDPNKHGHKIQGIPIVPVETLKDMSFNQIVIASEYVSEIVGQLKSIGISPKSMRLAPPSPKEQEAKIINQNESRESETSKCRSSLARFCKGNGLDVGYGGDPIVPTAICLDLYTPYAHYHTHPQHLHGDASNLHWFTDECLDYIYSTHAGRISVNTKVLESKSQIPA